MSSFSRRSLLLCLPLAACGFAPAYGPGSAMAGLQGRVRVADPTDKNGFDLVERLEESFGRPEAPLYDLTYTITTTSDAVGITPEGTITRYTLSGQIAWALIRRADQARITGGSVDSFTAYSATGSTVAGLAAEEDAALRLMRLLADQIVTQLIATSASWAP
jgi:LPS-assembly lipoprotein